ncbi:hypothetical protein [Streptomyces atratus]|uniref:hypothetical protein n=1 Tax=Streptomyces atratus TaxID=1893 RepID=UPI0018E59F8C|nr:hypothetical protein [Streptomyces atratus]
MGQVADLQRLVGARRLAAIGELDVVLHRGADGLADARVELGHGCSSVVVLDFRAEWGHAADVLPTRMDGLGSGAGLVKEEGSGRLTV